jgi:hypothetical protein
MLTGEELDVQSYYAQRSAKDTRPDLDNVSMVIAPISITAALANAAGLAEPEAGDVPYAQGRIVTTQAAADGFCRAPKFSVARLRLPAVPAHDVDMCTSAPEAPAYDVGYAFSNVRVYYTPAAIGTQFAADLTYTQGDCEAKYRVTAVYPMVSCAAAIAHGGDGGVAETPLLDAGSSDVDPVVDAASPDASEGMALDAGCPPPEPAPGPTVPDDALCEGAGINPDYDVACDAVTQMCVLKKEPPSLK